jgi:hypothetical protein
LTAVPDFDVHHEAGHAVAAHVLGVPIRCVTLHGMWTQTGGDPARAYHQGVISLSGPCAEDRHHRYGASERAELWDTVWRDDLNNAVRHLRIAGGDANQAMRQARRLVEEHWPLIERLAAALADRRELIISSAEITAVLGQGP